jgi:glucose/arabinose dehydrogenase
LRAEYNPSKLVFKTFFDPGICVKDIEGGRIHFYNYEGTDGFLLTTSTRNITTGIGDSIVAQYDTSPFGKILFFSLGEKNGDYRIISKGHRNPQGLMVLDNVILQTEHGPKGGDEINKIIYGKNYGFPIASYGDIHLFPKIASKDRSDYVFKKSHADNSFEEPIYAFVPSIGIQQIIKVPKSFSKYWEDDNFLVGSLNGRSLFRLKFDKNYSKIFFIEKIFIGERIRDIVFDSNLNAFILALEDTGSIGILSSPQSKQ